MIMSSSPISLLPKEGSPKENTTVANPFKRLLATGEYADLAITVGQDDEKKCFNVHKNIIATQSGYFKKLCGSHFRESATEEVSIPDIEATVFEHVLDYLYTNSYKMDDIVLGSKIFVAADYFDIPELRRISLDRIVSAVDLKKTTPIATCKGLKYKSLVLSGPQKVNFIEALANVLSVSQIAESMSSSSKVVQIVAKRFYELREDENFKALLDTYNTFTISLLYAVSNLTTSGFNGSASIELWCDVCKVFTGSSWICGNSTCRKRRGGIETFSNYKASCSCGTKYTTMRCNECKERRYPYKFR